MIEGKRNIIESLLDEYDIQSAEDIQDALKDLLGGTSRDELTSLYYSNANEIAKNFYIKSSITEVIETDGKGVKWSYKELSSDANKKAIAGLYR